MDAAEIKPKFVPDERLVTRDNSGGPGFKTHHGQWDDGGYVHGGSKSYLSATGGKGGSSKGDYD